MNTRILFSDMTQSSTRAADVYKEAGSSLLLTRSKITRWISLIAIILAFSTYLAACYSATQTSESETTGTDSTGPPATTSNTVTPETAQTTKATTAIGDDPSAMSQALQHLPRDFDPEHVPDSLTHKSFWFSDFERIVEIEGQPEVNSYNEFMALEDEQREKYISGLRKLTWPKVMQGLSDLQSPEWIGAGFDFIRVDQSVTVGQSSHQPVTPAYLEGRFNASQVRQKLLEDGYEEREAGGFTYYAKRDDYQTSLNSPLSHLNLFNRVYVDDERMVTSPATDVMEDILGAIAGEQPSLGSDPAFANLAASMGNPQTAEILTRAGIVEDGSIDEVEKPEDWGELHQWETAGFGMEIEGDGTRNLIYALYYNDPDAGEADADELMRRMSDFSSEITDRLFGVGNPFEACEFSVSYAVHDEGSTTTVICKVEEDAQIIPPWMLVDTGDLGFLVP